MSARRAVSYWYVTYSFPITLPTGPIDYDDTNFDALFVRTTVYDELDKYLNNIERQYGTFWVSSPGGGYGKSTMLNYIRRKLFLKLGELHALPIYMRIVKPYKTLEHAIFKGFLLGFLRLKDGFKLASRAGVSSGIQAVIEDFRRHEGNIRKFLDKLPEMSIEKLEARFNRVLGILNNWLEKGSFSKYVLLIDEMDKVESEEVLEFLGMNQGRFEELYDDYKFITFIAGHKPWVDRIHETTEYSFYHGIIFRLCPIVDIKDIKKLVVSRLSIYAYMNPADIPLTEDAYEKIREKTGGIPRRIIRLTQDIINGAYERKVASVGSGIIEKIITEGYISRLEEYLQSNYETYDKLKRAVDKRVDNILYVFYDFSPNHEIPKDPYDRDADARARYLGLELTNDEWWRQIEKLLRFECIVDRGNKRVLARDIADFFKVLTDRYPVEKSKIIPSLIRRLRGRITLPIVEELPPQAFFDAIDRAFKICPDKWLTEEEILDYFRDTTSIIMYIKSKFKGEKFDIVSKKLFKKYFRDYRRQMVNFIMVYEEKNRRLYRKLPKGMSINDYKVLKKSCPREVIDKYIEHVVKEGVYSYEAVKESDVLIEELIRIVSKRMNINIEGDFLRRRRRHIILRTLRIPNQIQRLIDSYIRLTKREPFIDEVIKPLVKNIVLKLSDYASTAKPIEEYELLRRLELNLRMFIDQSLSRVSKRWWVERVPEGIRKTAEDRMRRDERLWPWIKPPEKPHPIMYVSFSDYREIITRKDNWREVFKDVFKDENLIKSRLRELENIRNKVMHFRELAPEERNKLRIYTKEILECIKASKSYT